MYVSLLTAYLQSLNTIPSQWHHLELPDVTPGLEETCHLPLGSPNTILLSNAFILLPEGLFIPVFPIMMCLTGLQDLTHSSLVTYF